MDAPKLPTPPGDQILRLRSIASRGDQRVGQRIDAGQPGGQVGGQTMAGGQRAQVLTTRYAARSAQARAQQAAAMTAGQRIGTGAPGGAASEVKTSRCWA
jgi:hypothetical protein